MGQLKEKRCVLLWIKCQNSNVTKRSRPTSSELGADEAVDIPKTKRVGPGYFAHMKNMHEVDEMLKQKHEENFTPEQLCTWAHMIQMKKHSYDAPPDKPFFSTQATMIADTSISPVNKVNMRPECIQQIDEWYNLKQKCAIL